jgi:hypothetical protein
MLKVDQETIAHMDSVYPGIRESIEHHEGLELPACPHCGSTRTATVGVGLVGKSINLAGATDKYKLLANGPKPGNFYCNRCAKFFD